jgi:hypothetical protein
MKTIKKLKAFKEDDLYPDGVQVVVHWDNMEIGMSVFIPCINTQKAVTQAKKVFKNRKWQIKHKIKIENSKLGIRIWRTL